MGHSCSEEEEEEDIAAAPGAVVATVLLGVMVDVRGMILCLCMGRSVFVVLMSETSGEAAYPNCVRKKEGRLVWRSRMLMQDASTHIHDRGRDEREQRNRAIFENPKKMRRRLPHGIENLDVRPCGHCGSLGLFQIESNPFPVFISFTQKKRISGPS